MNKYNARNDIAEDIAMKYNDDMTIPGQFQGLMKYVPPNRISGK